jgi:hypothetical protein
VSTPAAAVGYVRSFNRFEQKYLVPARAVSELVPRLEPFLVADPNAQDERGYLVQSVYWDSPDMVFFWEKVDGQKYRRKLRFRRYADTEFVFVEIKQRTDQTVQKRRTRISAAEFGALFGSGRVDPASEHGATDPVLQEALFLCRHYSLEPKLAISYRRRAYFARHEHDLRMTIDGTLQYDPHALDPRSPPASPRWLLPADLCVLELKYNDRVPTWLIREIQAADLLARRFSKYCRGADLAFFEGRFTPDP